MILSYVLVSVAIFYIFSVNLFKNSSIILGLTLQIAGNTIKNSTIVKKHLSSIAEIIALKKGILTS